MKRIFLIVMAILLISVYVFGTEYNPNAGSSEYNINAGSATIAVPSALEGNLVFTTDKLTFTADYIIF